MPEIHIVYFSIFAFAEGVLGIKLTREVDGTIFVVMRCKGWVDSGK